MSQSATECRRSTVLIRRKIVIEDNQTPVSRSTPPGIEPAAVDLAALGDLTGFFVRMIQLRMFQMFHTRFEGTGISPGVLCALVAIGANPGVRAGVLGDALLIRRSNMTKLVDALERRGLVRRLPSDL